MPPRLLDRDSGAKKVPVEQREARHKYCGSTAKNLELNPPSECCVYIFGSFLQSHRSAGGINDGATLIYRTDMRASPGGNLSLPNGPLEIDEAIIRPKLFAILVAAG